MNRWGLVLMLLVIDFSSALAAPLAVGDVPPPLRSWVPWALYGHKPQECPFLYNQHDSLRCQWPSRLTLKLTTKGGEFSQQWVTFSEDWISLPGGTEYWPQEVKINDQPVSVIERGGSPSLYVQPGKYTITGLFAWDTLPQSLFVPVETGIVTLSLENRPVDFPELDDTGKLWLRRSDVELEQAEDRLDLKVYRRVTDEIPLMVTIRVDLKVSGKQREVVFGPALTSDYIPLSLNSPLPARLEPDGRLRVQVRPGDWSVVLIARHTGTRVATLSLPTGADEVWPKEEVWIFEARPHLRQVEIEGLSPIDPQQTMLPQDWRSLPAYQIRAGESLHLAEKRRGDPDPAPDQLSLQRRWWLDFNGGGYTIQDQINGTMTRGWRLDLNPPNTLGRVAVDGQEQFITKGEHAGQAGIELRRGYVSLVADSRLEGFLTTFPVVGWDHDFFQVSGQLHLPPGWRVVTARGVDAIPQAWLEQWTLMDLFVVFLIAAAVGKLWGRRWGVVALAALILLAHEPGVPWILWLHVLVATALLRALPSLGWLHRAAAVYRGVSLFMLVLVSTSFMLDQARIGLYPQLEQPWNMVGEVSSSPPATPQEEGLVEGRMEQKAKVQRQMEADENLLQDRLGVLEKEEQPKRAPKAVAPAPESFDYRVSSKISGIGGRSPMPQRPRQYDPNAAIQTGPGLPRWQWTTVKLIWSGPVLRSQEMSLFLLPPWVNRLLAFLRIVLLAGLLVCVCDFGPSRNLLQRLRRMIAPLATGAAMIALSYSPGVSIAQEVFPSQELLNELRTRLTQKDPPPCLPNCATSPRLRLEATGQTLRLRQEIHAPVSVAVPLPGRTRHWLPQTILLNGAPADGLFRVANGNLWLNLPEGQHQVIMEGPLPNREIVELAFPLKPYRMEVQIEGWEVEGMHEDGIVDAQLQLRRMRKQTDRTTTPALEPGTLPPFVRVERILHLGLTWGVDTRVMRVSPRGSAAVLAVPLLAGESITTAGVRVEKGKVLVNMAPSESQTGWSSLLELRAQLQLTAPETTAWTEIWRVDVSPLWRVQPTGIPVIHHSDQNSGYWFPEWHPWPGESVVFRISRPEGVLGPTLTIDHSSMIITPGRRATDVALSLELRSSRGGQHSLTLPEHVALQSASINGHPQALWLDGRTVTIPLNPGTQTLTLNWRQDTGISPQLISPSVNLGIDSVNAHIQIPVPFDRWVLWCGGPRLGPAVLFWGIFVVILLGAWILGQVPLTPLRTREWMLLGIGLSPMMIEVSFLVVLWLLALGARRRLGREIRAKVFNVVQVGLVILTMLALGVLFFAIQAGLLGTPDMRIAGNGSSNLVLRWYQDRASAELPHVWVWSLPILAYRLAMLAWALWVTFALVRWLRWGWECFNADGLWRKPEQTVPPVSLPTEVPSPVPSSATER